MQRLLTVILACLGMVGALAIDTYLPSIPAIGRAFDVGPVTVPQGEYLMLGDNRDNSADSRVIGLVPRKLLVGRAERVLVSADYQGNWMPRTERFGMSLYRQD